MRRVVLLTTLLLAVCSVLSAEPRTDAPTSARYQRIENLIGAEFAKSDGGALTVGIVEKGRLAWTKSYGFEDATATRPATTRTIYPIASITKLMTGVMLLQLVERGVVHLTDPVERYVPEIRTIPNPYPWTPPITLMQLATMTTGISGQDRSYPNKFPSRDSDARTWDQRLIDLLPQFRYSFEPSTRREYSNYGYAILGLALSRAAHRSYAEYVEEEILRPLGMTDSTFSVGEGSVPRFAYGSHKMTGLPSWEQRPVLPAAGVFSTLEDMVKFMRFQFGLGPESVLSHKALEESFRLVVPSDGDLRYGDSVGFAAVRNPDSNLVAIGHGGHTWFHIAVYEFDRAKQTGIIVLTTHETDEYKRLVRKGLKMINPTSGGGTGLPPSEEH